MKVEYQTENLSYGNYQVGHVIWITALDDERYVKLNVLDSAGNILYRLTGSADDTVSDIIYEGITQEQIADIQQILARNDPFNDWYDDDLDGTLRYFGKVLSLIHLVKKISRGDCESAIEYELFSHAENTETIHDISYFEKGKMNRVSAKVYTMALLMKHKEMDAINIKYFENGNFTAYRMTRKVRNIRSDNESG